jgi:hypothetical protein
VLFYCYNQKEDTHRRPQLRCRESNIVVVVVVVVVVTAVVVVVVVVEALLLVTRMQRTKCPEEKLNWRNKN